MFSRFVDTDLSSSIRRYLPRSGRHNVISSTDSRSNMRPLHGFFAARAALRTHRTPPPLVHIDVTRLPKSVAALEARTARLGRRQAGFAIGGVKSGQDLEKRPRSRLTPPLFALRRSGAQHRRPRVPLRRRRESAGFRPLAVARAGAPRRRARYGAGGAANSACHLQPGCYVRRTRAATARAAACARAREADSRWCAPAARATGAWRSPRAQASASSTPR